ncbi:MAG: DUF3283 family protein [Aliivibrio sp.]|uniref:DUF3283 family protein n=1 Tax=Aliivibrio sp. TaxID=1872443 RepID=UPI001A42D9BA|nr:DUF3283 family protein [Aliivibrio sp.]
MNLSLLPAEEKNRIELDKQAAYAVWQVKNGKAGYELFSLEAGKLTVENECEFFKQSVEKYKRKMGVQ